MRRFDVGIYFWRGWWYFILLLLQVLLYGEEADDNREFDVAEKRKQEGKKIR